MRQQFQAKRLPQHKGVAAWSDILGGRVSNPTLSQDEIADVTIIGGGFAGLSAARRLLQLDPCLRVVLLEAGVLAEGAAGRNSGFMIDLPHDLASDDYAGQGVAQDLRMIGLNRQAIRFAQEAVQDYKIDPNYADPVGKVNGAATAAGDAHNESYFNHLEVMGEASEKLDQQAMYELTGSRHYLSGLYTPGTLMLQPGGYIRGLGDGLSERIAIHENSPVVSIEKTLSDWTVRTKSGSVSTGKVILANNGHLESFGVAKGKLLQLFLYASMTKELDKEALEKLGGNSRWGITPSDPMGTTMRRIDSAQGGNRIITRTCATVLPGMVPNDGHLKRTSKVHRKKFDERFPQLSGMEMAYTWAGHLCLSLNGVSVMRQVEEGVFAACVQNGLGTARGTLSGIAAAELAMGETSDITAFFADEVAPKKLPPEPFATMGANTYLRWKEWRAGAE